MVPPSSALTSADLTYREATSAAGDETQLRAPQQKAVSGQVSVLRSLELAAAALRGVFVATGHTPGSERIGFGCGGSTGSKTTTGSRRAPPPPSARCLPLGKRCK